jgi:hypothetical protein
LIGGIELIVELAHGVFGFLPMPNLTDALSASMPDSLRNRSVMCELHIGPGMMTGMSVGIELGLAALEDWNNVREKRMPLKRSVSALAESEYSDMLSITDLEQLLYPNIALMQRSLAIPENCLSHFKINDTIFSTFNCLFHAIAWSITDPAQFHHRFVMEFSDWDISWTPLASHKLIRWSWFNFVHILK